MAKAKYYAVRVGKTKGIFNSWVECERNINGYSNAEYKSFSNRSDAEYYINNINVIENHKKNAKMNNAIIAYVDGSYSDVCNRYSFACIFINENGVVASYSDSSNEKEALSIKNVAGELQGAMFAVKWAHENKHKRIIIKYDYEGIEKWYSGDWKAKDNIVKKYVEFMNKYKNLIDINFEKVCGHSGDEYNEKVDRMAKKALNNNEKLSKGDSWVKIEEIKKDDIEVILDILKAEMENLNIETKNHAYGKMYVIIGDNKEKINLQYYSNKDKLIIQGKRGKIFSILLTYISELLNLEQMPNIFNEYCKLNIKPEKIKEQYELYLSNVKGNLPTKIENVLYQSIYNLNIDGDMFDPTFLVFPALRAFEGFLKHILNKHKIQCKDKFYMFKKKNNNTYMIDCNYNKNLGSTKKIAYVNKAFNFYHKNRHSLFHWNDPTAQIDDTRIIDSIDHAQKLIKDTLNLINEYYITN